MKISIIKADISDADTWAKIHIECWKAAYKGIIPDDYLDGLTIEERKKKYEKYFNNAQYYIMYYGIDPIGILSFRANKMEGDFKKTAELEILYLLPDFWGRGMGTKLYEFCLKLLKKSGYERVNLWVLEKNERARKFYENKGFNYTGLTDIIEIGKPLEMMRYELII